MKIISLASLLLLSISLYSQGVLVYPKNYDEKKYLSITDTSSADKLTEKLPVLFEEISNYMNEHNLEHTAPAFTIYHQFTPEQVICEVAFPVNQEVKGNDRIRYKIMPAGKALVADFYGHYLRLQTAHRMVQEEIVRRKATQTGPSWEEYITHPAAEPDPEKWLTKVWYPIE